MKNWPHQTKVHERRRHRHCNMFVKQKGRRGRCTVADYLCDQLPMNSETDDNNGVVLLRELVSCKAKT